MTERYVSLLFPDAEAAEKTSAPEPAHFVDLNLDQLAATLAEEKDEFGLLPLIHTPVQRDVIAHRHAVFRDLERDPVRAAVDAFLLGLERVREQRSRMQRAYHPHEKSRWLLDSFTTYCATVEAFAGALAAAAPASAAFIELARYLGAYAASPDFRELSGTTRDRLAELTAIRYDLLLVGPRVEVSRHEEQADYGAEIAQVFARFQSGKIRERHAISGVGRRQTSLDELWLNTVEERVLTQLVKLYPELFARVSAYVARYATYTDPVVERVARELQFYLRWRRYIAPLRKAGLPFCYPSFVDPGERIAVQRACDLVLARQLANEGKVAITNDFTLDPPERLLLVSGPNQGGKTTFARMFGQLHYLARLGVPIPGESATLLWWDGLYTHFERSEDIHSLRGKLEDDLVRIHAILERVDAHSIVIMNEIFSSTTTDDARFLGERILRRLLAIGAMGVCVTFIDDLARLDPAIVSMASTVDPRDPAIRTFRVVRKPPDGKAYAQALAAKHRLTRADLEVRL